MLMKIDFSVLLDSSRGADSRKKVLESLFWSAKNCSQISKEIGLNWRTVNRHLELLVKEGLVKSVSIGCRKFYKLTPRGEESIKNYLIEPHKQIAGKTSG
jgi:predicted transcriptional regulator